MLRRAKSCMKRLRGYTFSLLNIRFMQLFPQPSMAVTWVGLIVFNLRQSEVKNDRELVWDMIKRMGVIIRSEDVADIIRVRKKDGDEAVKPVIIEFKSEDNKWMVLRNKAD